MIKRDAGNRAQHGKIGIVALLGFEVIVERFIVPAIQVSGFGALTIGARLALELSKANLSQAVDERRLAHLGFPHTIAEQRMKVSAQPIKPARKICKIDFKRMVRRCEGFGKRQHRP